MTEEAKSKRIVTKGIFKFRCSACPAEGVGNASYSWIMNSRYVGGAGWRLVELAAGQGYRLRCPKCVPEVADALR